MRREESKLLTSHTCSWHGLACDPDIHDMLLAARLANVEGGLVDVGAEDDASNLMADDADLYGDDDTNNAMADDADPYVHDFFVTIKQ